MRKGWTSRILPPHRGFKVRARGVLLAAAVTVPILVTVPSPASTAVRGACSGRANYTWKTVDGGSRFSLTDGTATCYTNPIFRSGQGIFPFRIYLLTGMKVTFSGESVVLPEWTCGGRAAPVPYEMDVTVRAGGRAQPYFPSLTTPGQTSVQRWAFQTVNPPGFPPGLLVRIADETRARNLGRGWLTSRIARLCPPEGSPAATIEWTWEQPAVFT